MNKAVSALLVSVLILAGCAKNPSVVTPPGPPGPNQGLIDGADAIEVACEIASPLAGAFGSLISSECPPFVNGVVAIIEANGTLAKLQALVTTLTAEVNAVPGAAGNKLIADMLAAANGFVTIYATATGQTLAPVTAASARVLTPARSVAVSLSASDTQQLVFIQARAARLK